MIEVSQRAAFVPRYLHSHVGDTTGQIWNNVEGQIWNDQLKAKRGAYEVRNEVDGRRAEIGRKGRWVMYIMTILLTSYVHNHKVDVLSTWINKVSTHSHLPSVNHDNTSR